MTLKEKVQSGKKIRGTHVHLLDSSITEMFSYLGYDFIWVDMEHTQLTYSDVYQHIMAAKAGGTPVIVRVPDTDLTTTKKILEIGVDGIVFPMIRSYEHAKELLSWTLYPPYGKRGCGPKGAVRYGLDDEPTYYKEGHLKLCRFIQIETKEAAREAERLAQLPYVDGCVLGMHDLSGSIGDLGNIFCEENLALANGAIKAFREAGKCVGVSTVATDTETLSRYDNMGINMLSSGADYDYLIRGAKTTLEVIKKVQEN